MSSHLRARGQITLKACTISQTAQAPVSSHSNSQQLRAPSNNSAYHTTSLVSRKTRKFATYLRVASVSSVYANRTRCTVRVIHRS